MKRLIITLQLLLAALLVAGAQETLSRGVVVLPAQEEGNFVSWRMLATDYANTVFDVVRDAQIVASGIKLTNYTDKGGKKDSFYQIVTRSKGKRETASAKVTPWDDLFLRMPVSRPEGGVTPDGRQYAYTPNDCSVGDVDGDGDYELILKWEPTNAHDNSHDGYTGNVILDCYRLDGTQLWRIDLGRNIRAGAHYTQFLVYDFDGDGRAELICKTAPGSLDASRRYVSEVSDDEAIRQIDNHADHRNKRGRIQSGEELLTVFNGLTGDAIHTVWYNPNRGYGVGGSAEYAGWGDKMVEGNRGERYLACVAYLAGMDKNPSVVMCRGYYTRSYLWAVDFDGKHLSTRWLHASLSSSHWTLADGTGKIVNEAKHLKATAYGQGAHSIAVADVDDDGCDEITYGSAAIDHDGSLLYSTGLGHGDAQHLADLDPARPGLEYFMVHESFPYGADLRDARTGEIIWSEPADFDTGRGLAADIDPHHEGCEMWHIGSHTVKDIKGNAIADSLPAVNFRIYWDGDLQEELLANMNWRPSFPPYLQKWDGEKAVPLPLSNCRHFYEMGNTTSCNWTKATPNLQADIFGDWREELIFWDKNDASHLNIFTTNIPTDYRVVTLMHDHIYRMGVAWQNVSYNQPPHVKNIKQLIK
ncbi:MAG: rhamnogalacturonan lyase [Prevotella sp.]